MNGMEVMSPRGEDDQALTEHKEYRNSKVIKEHKNRESVEVTDKQPLFSTPLPCLSTATIFSFII